MKTRYPMLAFAIAGALAVGAAPALAVDQTPDDDTKHDSDQPVTDTWITTKVKAELATTDGVSSMDISVTTVDGVVTLTGTLDSATAVQKAVVAARSVKGVVRVDSSGLTSS